ncbi:MAG TPA: bifunctional acetate--CoA ligase family protein/GNAT family N-acetyltransferase [Thermoplasmata archaeon]|nr:bifunctional acetate--CoA ligase family protein/GNAT family N-acetyltransferase [Thermoplasmata archaeon]
MGTTNLDRIFKPRVVAILGASDTEGSVGYAVTANFVRGLFEGKSYLVNNHKSEILGVKAYPNIAAVPETVDLAIIATPAKTVAGVVDECGRAGVKGVVILSAGFKETGPAGKALEDEIVQVANKYGIRVVGPNCLGIIRPATRLNGTFLSKVPKPGTVAFLSQSGALGSAILDTAIHENIGFSTFVSVGSMVDVDFGDLIDYFGSDPQTRSILMYIEGVTNARRFMSAARHFARSKPIVVVKAGRFRESAKAVASHTGSLSGEDAIYEAAFKRAGVVRVDEIADLFNAAEVLSTQPLPSGPRLAIITNAGGPGVMTTDALLARGGKLAELSPKTMERLNAALPPFWSHGNPVDLIGDAGPERYRAALEACLDDEGVDGILILLTVQAMINPLSVAEAVVDVLQSRTYQNKTILASFMGRSRVTEANSYFAGHNIPTYDSPEMAVKTYLTMYQYRRNIELLYETPEEISVDSAPPRRPITVILQQAAKEGREVLTEEEAKRVLKYYGFPVVSTETAATADEAAEKARRFGFPVVLKILSPDIPHKSEAGGVVLDIGSEEEVRRQFDVLIARAKSYKEDAQILGVTVQPMIGKGGHELIVGGKVDPLFGPTILFGMGGIGVELYRDTAVGIPPLNTTLIRRMLEETKVYQVLKGYRNQPRANLELLEKTLLLFSQLMVEFPQIKEIDINPLVLTETKVHVLDARILVDKNLAHRPPDAHSHLVISPYPKKYEARWRMSNGQDVLLRPIKPEDEPMWLEMFKAFSEESIRYRFFQVIKDTPHEVRVRYCNIDYDREIAIVPEITQNGKRRLLGVGRLSIEPDGKSGEFAIIVTDEFQNVGLGTKLTDHVLEVAEDMGVERVYSVMLAENYRALSLMKRMGFTLTYSDDGTVEASLNLKGSGAAAAPPPPTQPLRPPDEEELAPLSPSLGGPAKPVTEGSKVALPASTSKSNSALR